MMYFGLMADTWGLLMLYRFRPEAIIRGERVIAALPPASLVEIVFSKPTCTCRPCPTSVSSVWQLSAYVLSHQRRRCIDYLTLLHSIPSSHCCTSASLPMEHSHVAPKRCYT